MELTDPVNSVIIISTYLTEMVNFPTSIPDCEYHSPALLDLFFCTDASIFSSMAFSPLEILIMLLSQFSLIFHQTQKGKPYFIVLLVATLVLIGTVFVII